MLPASTPRTGGDRAAALELLGPRVGRLTLVAVRDRTVSVAADERAASLRAELEGQGDLATSRLAGHGHAESNRAPELLLAAGNPAEVLGRLAAEGGYDLLVVGNRGAGLSKALLGSVATSLAAGAKVPLLVGGSD